MAFTFDPRTTPFSRYGSYLAISMLRGGKSPLSIRTVHGEATFLGVAKSQAFTITLLANGRPVSYSPSASPWELTLQAKQGAARFCFSRPDTIRFTARGVGVRLFMGASHNCIVLPDGDNWVVNSFGTRRQFYLKALAGPLNMDAPWKGTKGGAKNWTAYTCGDVRADFLPAGTRGTCEGSVEIFKGSWQGTRDSRTYRQCVGEVRDEYGAWQAALPPVKPAFRKGRETASYVNWSSVVAPAGNFKRPAMLMSKNWMNAVWSWDHVFNAMGTLAADPKLAWDQFMVMFDTQDEKGALPDAVTDSSVLWNFTKPPVHGWALRWMMRRSRFINKKRMAEAYGHLTKWTDWWFTYRDADRDGLPGYNHGNDSGWDNATLFMAGPPLTGPDLASFLVIQMDVLAEIAYRLGKKKESVNWKNRADKLYVQLVGKLWDGERFIATSPRGSTPINADSLISFVPLVLGRRLAPEIRKKLIAGLTKKGRFLTKAGLASEALTSPYYSDDSYWQGAVWASANMLIIDGLAEAGETGLAQKIARSFCANASKHGMAENYNARTGRGQCDPAYTWTSSVFLVLAQEYV